MTPFRPTEIFRALDDRGVDFLVIGGIAVQAHAVPRSTLDTDIVVDRSPKNLARLRDALVALEAVDPAIDPLSHLELDPGDEVDLARARVARIDTREGRLDLIHDPPGADDYAGLAGRAIEVGVAGVRFRVVGLDDLIAMKRAAGRTKDLLDLADLTNPATG